MVLTEKNKFFLAKAKKQYGDDVETIFDYSKVDYQRAKMPITIRCIKHNLEFAQIAASHLGGAIGCKMCRREKPPRAKIRTKADVIALGTKMHKGLDTYEHTNFVNSRTKIMVTCKKHGNYEISTGTYLQGNRCTACGVESKQLPLSDLKIKVREVHGDKYTYDWDSYINSSNKMRIKCPVHGWFEQRVNTHISGRGCRICGVDSRRYSSDKVLGKIKSHFRDRYTYDKFVYVRDGDPVIITCKKHGDFSKVPNELVRGNGCPACTESKAERTMSNILTDNGIAHVQEHKLPGAIYRYDFYLPKLNVLIELDGKHHHASIAFYGGDKGLANMQRRDMLKNLLAVKHDIPLVRIKYTEFGCLHKAFFRELSKIYKYRVKGKFYKCSEDLPKSIKTSDADKYLTYNAFKITRR